MKYSIWYMRPDWFRQGIMGTKPDPNHLGNTHAFIKNVKADNLEAIFCMMQGENWDESDLSLIDGERVGHTSMSIGDVAVDHSTGNGWMVDTVGWSNLGATK